MTCDDEVDPLHERLETLTDEADLEYVLQHRTPLALCRLHSRP
jgi:hypothetical protein